MNHAADRDALIQLRVSLARVAQVVGAVPFECDSLKIDADTGYEDIGAQASHHGAGWNALAAAIISQHRHYESMVEEECMPLDELEANARIRREGGDV